MSTILDFEDNSNSITRYDESNYKKSNKSSTYNDDSINVLRKNQKNKLNNLQKKYSEEFEKDEKKKGALYNFFLGGNNISESQFKKNNDTYKKYQEEKKKLQEIDYQIQKEKSDKQKITNTEHVALPFVSGITTGMEGLKAAVNKISGQNDVENEINSNDIRYEKLKKVTKNPLERIYQDLTYTTGNMVPSMITGNPTASLLTTGLSSAGTSYNQAKRDGKTENQATLYGIANGSMEAGLQKVLGGISSVYGNSVVGSKVSNAVGKVIKNPTVSKLVSEAGSEFTEEYLQEILDPVVRNITMNEKNEFKPFTEEALYSGMLGALNSGLINGSNITVNKIQQKKLSNPIVPINKENNINDINSQEKENSTGIQYTKSTNSFLNNNIKQNRDVATNSNVLSNDSLFTESFDKQVDKAILGTFNKNNLMLVSDYTPLPLQKLGVKNHPITLSANKLDRIMNHDGKQKGVYHNLGKDMIKQLPNAINNPLDIIKSHSNSYVMTTNLIDKQNNPVIASIRINQNGIIDDIEFDTNVLTSAYGRNNYDNYMKRNQNNVVFDVDRGIIKKNQEGYEGLQLSNSSNLVSIDNISQNSNIVNNSNMQQTQNNAVTLPITKEMREKLSQHQVTPTNEIKQSNLNKSPVVPISEKLQNKTAELLDRRPNQTKKSFKDSYEFTKQQLVNKGHYVDKLAKKAGNKELTFKYDKMLSSPAEGHYSIGVAQTDNNGNKIGKSIIDIWQPVEKANKVNEFSDYLLNKHNINRIAQGKPVFGENVTAQMSSDKVLQYEKSNPEFKDWAKDINTYNKNQLQNMVDAGLTSQDTQKYLNETYENYVRINRDIKSNAPITNSNGKLKVNVPIKKAKGGNQDILPLKESMAQQTLEIKNAIRRNEFGLELLNTLKNGKQDLEYDGKNYILKNDNDGTYSLTVFKDGTPIKMEIDEGLYESIKPSGKYTWEGIIPFKVAQKVSNIQRNLLTVDNPLFVLTNFFKDIGDAPFNSKFASKFYLNYIKAVSQIKNNGELWQKYRALGGEQNTYFTKEKGITPLANNKAKMFVEKINKVNEAVEQAPRLAEFISTLEAGGTLNEAMYNASEITTNFKRGGDVSKALNRNGAMFLNASIQGFDKQIRNFTGQRGAKGYINLLSKATLLGVVPSLLNNMLLGDDDDYKNLPDYAKDTYYLFKTSDDNFIRIPKGRVISIFGSAARRSTELGKNENSFDGFNDLLINQVAPNNPLEDNVLAPIISVKNNRSWNGSEIVPRRLQDELPENQYDEKTDAISKAVGKTFKVSPKKVNYLLDQYTGGVGDFILPMITPKAQQNPLSAKFTTNSTMNNKNVNLFFDSVDKSAKVKNSPTATDEDMLRYKYLTSKQKEMNDLYQEKREIEMSSLNNKEKISSVKEVQKKINEIAKISLENKDDIDIDSNYSKVSDIQFYKNSKNEWQKITDKMLDKQHEVEKIGFLPNTYYKNYVELNSISSSDKDKYVKKGEIINHILNEDITEKQKAYLYGQYYSKPETMDLLAKGNISISGYLTLQDRIKDIKAIDDPKSDIDGKTISGSKKRQIIKEIAKLPVSEEQKLILIALEGYSISTSDNIIIKKQRVNNNQFRGTVFNYVNRQPLTAKEKREILEKAGYTFYENGKMKKTW